MRPKCHSISARSAAIAAMLYKQMLFTWQLKWSQMYSNVKIIKRCQKHLGIYWYWCDTWQTRRHTSVLWTHTHEQTYTPAKEPDMWTHWTHWRMDRMDPESQHSLHPTRVQPKHCKDSPENPWHRGSWAPSVPRILQFLCAVTFLPWDTCFFQRQCDFRLSSHLE
jgi:hypothetical protein